MEKIFRELYDGLIRKQFGKGEIIVLSGHRRAGKSIVLESVAQKYSADSNMIYLDMENPQNAGIKDFQDLNVFIQEHFVENTHNFLLIDEVQEIAEFEKTLCFYAKQDNLDIVVTGSNAYMLSSEIATLLAGRHRNIHIWGLNYDEFLLFYKLEDTDDSLLSYMKWGGLPFLHNIPLDDVRSRTDYLESIYNTIFVKDIVTKKQIRNVTLLDNLVRFLASNTGKIISANSIAKYLKNVYSGFSTNTVADYIHTLCDSYLMDKVNRYDIKGKRIFEQQEKYYFEDIGIRNCLCVDNHHVDLEKIMENLVYIKLKQLGYNVFIGELNGKEIDFVVKNGTDLRYVQVTLQISSPETYEREYGNLKMIRDNYPKYVITMDKIAELVNDEGIKTLSFRHFLKNGFEE